MNLPRLGGGAHRDVSGRERATAGVEPAFKISCRCNGTPKQPPRSCTCDWVWGACCGSSTSSADGSSETSYGCGVTCEGVRDRLKSAS
jgi:hypothetical protein